MPSEGKIVDSREMKIGKQIVLPWSKAVEIAVKSMKVRFGRSVVTTASIVLAIAFLMSILTSTTVIASLKTEPRRRVIELRDREARVKKGEDVGLRCPEEQKVDRVRGRVRDLEADLKSKADPLERRLVQAELAVAQAELEVLVGEEARATAPARIAALEQELKGIPPSSRNQKEIQAELDALVKPQAIAAAAERLVAVDKELKDPTLDPKREGELRAERERLVKSQAMAAELRRVEELRQTLSDPRLAPPRKMELQAQLDGLLKTEAAASAMERVAELERGAREAGKRETAEKNLAQLRGLPARIAENLAKWPALRARADVIEAENGWTMLVRMLRNEGYADVELEITQVPPRISFAQMMLTQMDARDKWLAALAAMVCFVGIMNAMLMSVHERFREIGTMKCLGALESFIVKIYFLESSFIGLVGTLIGIAAGLLLSLLRAATAYGFGPVFLNFDLIGVLLSAAGTLVIGALLSVGAAIFPAMSAAKMEPVVAMRVDE